MKRKHLWKLTESMIDAENASWAYEFAADCRKADLKPLPQSGRYEGGVSRLYGNPGANLFKKNIEKYRKLSQPPETSEDVQVGRRVFKRKIDMKGHSVRLLKLSPLPGEKQKKSSFAWGFFDFLF